jgi:hypothetical protein
MDEANDAVKGSLDKMSRDLDAAGSSFESLQNQAKSAFSGIESALTSCMGAVAGMTAILGGGKLFSEAINSTVKWAEEVASLSRTLGVTMESASYLNTTLHIIGASAETYTSAFMKLERQIKQNEKGLNDLGIVTRDSNGALLDGQTVMQNALDTMRDYKVGQDQNLFAITAFGRGAAQIAPLLLLTKDRMKEGIEAAKTFGLVIGTDDVAAMRNYEFEVNKAHLLMHAFEERLAVTLMKALKDLAEYFNSEGPSAISTWESALQGLEQILDGLVTQGKAFMETFRMIGQMPRAIASDAKNAYSTAMANMDAGMGGREMTLPGPSKVGELLDKTNQAVDKLITGFETKWQTGGFVGPRSSLAPPGDTGKGNVMGAGGTKEMPPGMGKGGADDYMAKMEEELNRIKDSQQDLNAWSTAKDYEFWASKLAAAKTGSDQWWEIWHKMAEEFRTMTAEQQKQAEASAKNAETIAKGVAAMQKSDADTAIKIQEEKINEQVALEQIGADERFKALQDLYNRQYTAELKGFYDELAVLQQRGDATLAEQVKVWEEIEKAQNQHLLKMQKDQNQYLNTEKKEWDHYADEVGSALTGIMFHHQSLYRTLQQYEEKFFGYVIDTLLKKMVSAWLMTETTKTAATTAGTTARSTAENMGFFTAFLQKIASGLASWFGFETAKTGATTAGASARTAAETAAALAGKAVQVGTNITTITADAGVTFAGTMAALSGIPYIGPYIAPPMASAAMAEVMSMLGMASFDVGAWEVPGDMLAQIHGGEMIVPANFAEGMRSAMGGEGTLGGARGGGQMHMHVHSMDSQDVSRALTRSNSTLNKLLKKSIRDGNMKLRR